MRLELTGRHVAITPAVRKLVEQHLQHTLRVLNDSAVSAQVVLTREKTRLHADVTLHARGEHFLHGEAGGRDIATALGAAVDKIDKQALKLKGKWKERKRRAVRVPQAAAAVARPERAGPTIAGIRAQAAAAASTDGQRLRIIRARRYEVRPMSVDEAALEVGDGTEAFLVFRNALTDAINVLFRRADGQLGLIETEA